MSEHGTISRYSNDECRCDLCRRANADYGLKRRKERAAAVPDDKHGKASTYTNWRCRCTECRAAHAKSMRDYFASRRAKKAQGMEPGTRERTNALVKSIDLPEGRRTAS